MSPSSSAKNKPTAKEQPEAKSDECVHHWVIDPPNGAVSQGRCKACGEEREFRNSFEYSSWYGNKSPGAKGGAKGGAQAGAAQGGAAGTSTDSPAAGKAPADKK
ncbi:MAG: hypothetical protein QF357_12435 [Dehalococcoidia bacterium]|jgi:hypothetical protein|nr:hypothetical protein [Dehalococcoidia bacterium]